LFLGLVKKRYSYLPFLKEYAVLRSCMGHVKDPHPLEVYPVMLLDGGTFSPRIRALRGGASFVKSTPGEGSFVHCLYGNERWLPSPGVLFAGRRDGDEGL